MGIEYECGGEAVKCGTQLLQLWRWVLAGFLVTGSDTIDSAIAALATEKRLKAHAYGDITLLESRDVLWVLDVADTSDNIAFFLIYLDHFLCSTRIDIAEQLHLERDFINVSQVIANTVNAWWKDFVTIAIDPLLEIIVLQTDPRVEHVGVHAEIGSHSFCPEHVFLWEVNRSNASIFELFADLLGISTFVVLEAHHT